MIVDDAAGEVGVEVEMVELPTVVMGVDVTSAVLEETAPVPIHTARSFSPVKFANSAVSQSPVPSQGFMSMSSDCVMV